MDLHKKKITDKMGGKRGGRLDMNQHSIARKTKKDKWALVLMGGGLARPGPHRGS